MKPILNLWATEVSIFAGSKFLVGYPVYVLLICVIKEPCKNFNPNPVQLTDKHLYPQVLHNSNALNEYVLCTT